MCTLTIIPWQTSHSEQECGTPASRTEGLRVVFNRDESPLRPEAFPPRERRFGDSQVFMPVDPVSGGTWIAATDSPLILALMNVYPADPNTTEFSLRHAVPPAQRISRGGIIPHVGAAQTLTTAIERARALEFAHYEPFRLLVIDRHRLAEVLWSGAELSIGAPTVVHAPHFFTSSGLGDEIVANPRRRLFEEMISSSTDWSQAQDAFHRHVWPGSERTSVWMTRPEARTMSRTIVELRRKNISMRYEARLGATNEVETSTSFILPLGST